MKKMIIGIDPGIKTGFAVKTLPGDKFDKIRTLRMDELFDNIRTAKIEHEVFVIVEDARQRNWYGVEEQRIYLKLRRRQVITDRELSTYTGMREGAGAIKIQCKIIEAFLKKEGVQYKMVKPVKNKTKWNPEFFKKVTGYQFRTSEHGRDAALLIQGINEKTMTMMF